jgi:hypothetical protein
MADHTILGVHVTDRLKHAVKVQEALTQFGGLIKTRLGLHEIGQGRCSSKNGLVLLELVGPDAKCKQLAAKLAAIEGIEVQQMVFKH